MYSALFSRPIGHFWDISEVSDRPLAWATEGHSIYAGRLREIIVNEWRRGVSGAMAVFDAMEVECWEVGLSGHMGGTGQEGSLWA